jgi:drug/metabolite transporter (DMT)-like permease
LGVLLAAIPLARNRMQTAQVHPIMPWMLVLFVVASVLGSLASLLSVDDDPYYYMTTLRNFSCIPLAAVAAYFLTHWPKHAKRFAMWLIIAGVGAGVMVALFYRQKAEVGIKYNADINSLRTMEYGPAIAGIAAAFLLYQIISGFRMMPLLLTIVLAFITFIGQCATLSRSDWVAIGMAIAGIYLLLPKEGRRGKVIKGVLAAPLVMLFIWLGIMLASNTLGIDFQKRMVDRVMTMLPGERTFRTVKAWDSRLASQIREVELWAQSPLFGQGFGHRRIRGANGAVMGGYGHNTWTHTLFQTGPVGLAAISVVVFGMWVLGRRMIREARGDKTFTLVGAMGACAAVFFLFHGLTTASFNAPRPAIFLGLIFGVVIRTRQMQVQTLQELAMQQYLYEQELEEQGYVLDDRAYVAGDPAHLPAFGTYQHN